MLDLNYLRENIETARQRLAGRGFLLDVETFQRLDGERKSIIHDVERLRQLRNSASEEIAKLLREKVDVTAKRNEMKLVSQQIKDKEEALRIVEEKLFQFASTIPNLPDPAVPVGPTDEQNVEVRRVGDPPRFDFSPKAHWDLCPPLGILDLERASKIAGSRFPLLAGMGARLERALMNLMLDLHTKERGYKEFVYKQIRVPFFRAAAIEALQSAALNQRRPLSQLLTPYLPALRGISSSAQRQGRATAARGSAR